MGDLISRNYILKEIEYCEQQTKRDGTASMWDFFMAMEAFRNTVKKAPNANADGNGWIPCTERLPANDNDTYILLSFENFNVPCVGRYIEDEDGGTFYVGDEDESCISQDMYVNAWMPLPASYRECEQNG